MSVVGLGKGDRKAGGGAGDRFKKRGQMYPSFSFHSGEKKQLFLLIDTNTFCFHLFSSSYNKSAVSFF